MSTKQMYAMNDGKHSVLMPFIADVRKLKSKVLWIGRAPAQMRELVE